MRYYLRSRYRASLMLFRRGDGSDRARAKSIDAHNTGIISDVLHALTSGAISYAHVTTGGTKCLFTRSSRGEWVQVTHFARIRGEWVPTYHTDAHNAKEAQRDLPSGCYLYTVA